MTDKLHDGLTRNLNTLRAAASRGPVTSREIFQMTDGMMDLLSRAALAAAPQPAPDREALVQVIREASSAWSGHELRGPTRAEAIADALLARGLRLPGDETMTSAARDVLAERQRQINVEGWTPEDDDRYENGDLANAAACYAVHAAEEGAPTDAAPSAWPWDAKWWKPSTPRRDLVKAGALILAEIERLDRAEGDTP